MNNTVHAKGLLRSALLASSLMAASLTYAGESVIRFCTDSVNAIGSGSMTPNLWYSGALEIDASVSSAFSGCTLDSLQFALGRTTTEEVTVFISRGLDSAPVWQATVAPEGNGIWQSVEVDGGFSIDGKPFYVGYKLQEPTWTGNPLCFDRAQGSPYLAASHISIASSESLLATAWQPSEPELGNISIGCFVSGENLPKNYACASGVSFGEYQKPGVPFRVLLPVVNLGSEPMQTLAVEVSAGENTPQTLTLKPGKPIEAGATDLISFEMTLPAEAVEETASFCLTEVNGEKNPQAAATATGSIICSDDLYPRALVVEDFTGSTCGYCPIGYVAMDKLTEEFKDSEHRFVPIAIHNYGQSRVHCDAYDDFITHYNFASAPASIVNRERDSFPSFNNLLGTWSSMPQLSVGAVNMEATFTDEEKTAVNVKATMQFARDYDSAGYALCFVFTEDNLGPYLQSNYYNDNPDVPEFYQKGDHVMMMYNHVARDIVGWDGIDGSVPASIGKGQEYPYMATLKLDACKNRDATRLICLLLRKSDGVIMNADYVDLADVQYVSLDTATQDFYLRTRPGTLSLFGNNGDAKVYDIAGGIIASATLTDNQIDFSLPSGIYIVAANGTCRKVIIK